MFLPEILSQSVTWLASLSSRAEMLVKMLEGELETHLMLVLSVQCDAGCLIAVLAGEHVCVVAGLTEKWRYTVRLS